MIRSRLIALQRVAGLRGVFQNNFHRSQVFSHQMARWLQVCSILLLATYAAVALECLNNCRNSKSSDCGNNGCQQQNCGSCSNVNCGSCTSNANSCCQNCCGGINNNCECQQLDCTKCQGTNSCCQRCCKPSEPVVKCCETANQTSIKECCEKNGAAVTTVLHNQCCQQPQVASSVYQPVIPNIILPNITIFINQTPVIVHNNPNINVDHRCGNVSVLASPSHSMLAGCGGPGAVPAPRNPLCCRVRRPPICMPIPTPPLIRCFEQSSPVTCGPQCLPAFPQPPAPPPCQPTWPTGQCRTPCTGYCQQGVPQQGCVSSQQWPFLQCHQGGNGYGQADYSGSAYPSGYPTSGYPTGYPGSVYSGAYPGVGYSGGYPGNPLQDNNSPGIYDLNAIAPHYPRVYMVNPAPPLDVLGGDSNPGIKTPDDSSPLKVTTGNESVGVDPSTAKKSDEKPPQKTKAKGTT